MAIHMKRYGILILAVLSFLLVSCKDRNTGKIRPVKLVEDIIADTSSYEYHQLLAAAEFNSHGTIAVVGDPKDVMIVTEYLLTCDFHDNISGQHKSDGLPDFSGETVAQILDDANAPYDGYIAEKGEEALRTLNVRNFLNAVDTVSLISPLDETGVSYKQRAKVVVFASSLSSAYGHYDADTLCKRLGVDVPVIAPVQAMVDYAEARHEGPLNLVVWSDSKKLSRGTYSSSMEGLNYQAFAPVKDSLNDASGVRKQFLQLLDMYMDAGNAEKVSAMLLDDYDIPADLVSEAVSEILLTDDDNLLIYRNILEPDFECITPGRAIADRCYKYLRTANAFTHRIAYPELRSYITIPSTDEIVELRDRYLSSSLMEFMLEYAPKTFSLYVR